MASNYCSGRIPSPVVRDTMGNGTTTVRRFRGRTARPGRGSKTQFSSNYRALTFDKDFYATCDRWGNSASYLFNIGSEKMVVKDWVDVGTKACHRYTWAHNRARGFDLCAVTFTNGFVIDCNYSPTAGIKDRRLYLALWASLRRFFGTVLTADYNAAHRDHIHFDNRLPVTVISKSKRSDTALIQRACDLLLPRSVAVDGDWGPQTSAAYAELLKALNMQCRDPLRVHRDMIDLLYFIIRTCVDNTNAGRYRSVEC